jgi:hypothetical protein
MRLFFRKPLTPTKAGGASYFGDFE